MKRFRGMRTLRLRTGPAVVAASACVLGLAVPAAQATRIVPWKAVEVLSPAGGGYAELVAIACVGARPCVGAGSYSPAKPPGTREAMVAAESEKGRWSRAVLVRLPSNEAASLQDATLASVACPSARSCVAVGYYTWGSNNKGGLITTGHGTTWSRGRTPVLPRGVAASEGAALSGVSCPRTGDCEAVGGWGLGSGQAMAEAMTRGRWQRAVTIPPPANADTRPAAYLSSVSCTGVGQCVAVGGYTDKTGAEVAMAALESKGKWGRAVEVGLPRGAAASPTGTLYAVSCAGKATCEAAGDYTTSGGAQAAFVEEESRGRWRDAVQITSLPSGAQTSPPTVELGGISCTPASCLTVGTYRDKAGGLVPMTVLGSGRTWERAKSFGLPHGAAAGSGQSATLIAVTCDAADIYCTGVGDYTPVGGLATGATEAMAAAGGM
jgi:hypothetical protein